MITITNRYCVQDGKTGEILAAGSVTECLKQVGICSDTFYRELETPGRFLITHLPNPEIDGSRKAELAKQWDEFIEPIRKRFGVEVKRNG